MKGQDILIITMAIAAPRDQQNKLIEAAAEANVSWILPNEWGSDTAHPAIQRNPTVARKLSVPKDIEKLGKSNWIGVVNNQWYEWSVGVGSLGYGIDVPNKKAQFYDDGNMKTVTTTWPRVGEAVAKLISLPVSGASPSLNDFKNQRVYISSFFLSQREMLDAAQRSTGTTDKDWEITKVSPEAIYEKGVEEIKRGNFQAASTVIYAGNFIPNGGNDYIHHKRTLNQIFGLTEEDLDKATKDAIEFSKDFKPYW